MKLSQANTCPGLGKLMPRWGGSREAVEEYAQMALAHSANQEGTQVYARIYYYIARSNSDGDPRR